MTEPEPRPENLDSILLGGRRWHVPPRSLRQRLWLEREVRAAGLADVPVQPGESGEQFAVRLLYELRTNSHTLPLLAGFLAPAGEKWSEAQAQRTAEFLGDLDQEADLEQIDRLLLFVFQGFLASRLRSAGLSRTASAQPAAASREKELPVAPPASMPSGPANAEASCSPTTANTAS